MAYLFRRRLTCFYCGRPSAEKQSATVRQWKCRRCEAVNYLDENGQITDPPAFTTPQAVRYGHSIQRATPPAIPASDESLFCATCQKNQLVLTESLAAYLPAPNDPQYAAFEASYPQYRIGLEKRYPQVCAKCAPRVRQRIRAAGYAAKTDHLRRLMERTKQAGHLQRDGKWRWRDLVVVVGGMASWASLCCQLAWNAMGASVSGSFDAHTGVDAGAPSLSECVLTLQRHRKSDLRCLRSNVPLAEISLLLAASSVWWNNKLYAKLHSPTTRAVGWADHFKLQIISLMVRTGSWYWLRDPAQLGLSLPAFKAAHLFSIVFALTVAIISTTLVTLDNTPRVSFQENSEPWTPAPPSARHQIDGDASTRPAAPHFTAQSPSFIKPFPINHLAPSARLVREPTYSPPSASPGLLSIKTESDSDVDDDDPNAMEWTPTRPEHPTLHPMRPVQPPQLQQPPLQPPTPSPFRGSLPAAPISPAHRLRNPPNQQKFRRTPLAEQKNFFSKLMISQRATVDSNEGAGLTGSTNEAELRPKGWIEMADSKLKLQEDAVETGLESMFNSVFSIRDEPAEVRASEQEVRVEPNRRHDDAFVIVAALAILPVTLGLVVLALKSGVRLV